MSELVPEQRMDRNGRMVRRWVRPALAARRQPLPIPQPATGDGAEAAPDPSRRQRELYAALRIEESWAAGSKPYLEESEVMRRAIGAAPDDAVDEALNVLAAHPGSRTVRGEVKRTLRLLDSGSASPEYAARRLPFVAVEARSATPQHVPSIHAMRGSIELVAGDEFEPEALTAEQFEQALSLAHVLAAIGNGEPAERRVWLDGHGWRKLADRHPGLVRLAVENPERGIALADFLTGRGPDVDAAEQFLARGAAFASGIL